MVKNWFGNKFELLHPLLQQLHLNGGQLRGDVHIRYGKGLAGVIGRRLGKKLNIPGAGQHQLLVNISHHADGLHWDRSFNNDGEMKSLFTPVGTIDKGHWIENTGPIEMRLRVDTANGGWRWVPLGFRFIGIPLPLWLFPKSQAYKFIKDGQYHFHVSFSMPVIGQLLCYEGALSASTDY